jgi:hypothetical protein
MKSITQGFLVALAFFYVLAFASSSGFGQTASELVGTWDYTSITNLKNGKPFGTVHFQPGQWTITYKQDGTWTMNPALSSGKPAPNGRYVMHGHDVDMKLVNGSRYERYRFAIEQDGRELELTSKETIITASREK